MAPSVHLHDRNPARISSNKRIILPPISPLPPSNNGSSDGEFLALAKEFGVSLSDLEGVLGKEASHILSQLPSEVCRGLESVNFPSAIANAIRSCCDKILHSTTTHPQSSQPGTSSTIVVAPVTSSSHPPSSFSTRISSITVRPISTTMITVTLPPTTMSTSQASSQRISASESQSVVMTLSSWSSTESSTVVPGSSSSPALPSSSSPIRKGPTPPAVTDSSTITFHEPSTVFSTLTSTIPTTFPSVSSPSPLSPTSIIPTISRPTSPDSSVSLPTSSPSPFPQSPSQPATSLFPPLTQPTTSPLVPDRDPISIDSDTSSSDLAPPLESISQVISNALDNNPPSTLVQPSSTGVLSTVSASPSVPSLSLDPIMTSLSNSSPFPSFPPTPSSHGKTGASTETPGLGSSAPQGSSSSAGFLATPSHAIGVFTTLGVVVLAVAVGIVFLRYRRSHQRNHPGSQLVPQVDPDDTGLRDVADASQKDAPMRQTSLQTLARSIPSRQSTIPNLPEFDEIRVDDPFADPQPRSQTPGIARNSWNIPVGDSTSPVDPVDPFSWPSADTDSDSLHSISDLSQRRSIPTPDLIMADPNTHAAMGWILADEPELAPIVEEVDEEQLINVGYGTRPLTGSRPRY